MKNFEKYELSFDLDAMVNDLCQKCDPFTDDEKIILNNLPEKYKWIARNKNGDLVVYDKKPRRNDYGSFYVYYGFFIDLRMFKHLFRNITWQSGAVCFRGDECE